MFRNLSLVLLALLLSLIVVSCELPETEEFIDETKPVVTITNPNDNSEFTVGDGISIYVTATDSAGIKEVKFYIDDVLVETDTSESYNYSWYTDGYALGTHVIKVNAVDINGNTSESQSVSISLIAVNNWPLAKIEVSQVVGNLTTVFQFDASASSDEEDADSDLQIRWDWENDGTYDTDYSTSKIVTHTFVQPGYYLVRGQIKDSGDQTSRDLIGINIVTNELQTVTDIDGNDYQAAKIGDQWWMIENLKTKHYRDGVEIPYVTDNTDWSNSTTGACVLTDLSGADQYLGLFYNWYAVNDSRGIAPAGWHVPTDDEWKELELYIGMSQTDVDAEGLRGTNDEGKKLRSAGAMYNDWGTTDQTANSSGFTALPGGARENEGYMGSGGAWFWTATETNNSAWMRTVGLTFLDKVGRMYKESNGDPMKNWGLSVRCVKD